MNKQRWSVVTPTSEEAEKEACSNKRFGTVSSRRDSVSRRNTIALLSIILLLLLPLLQYSASTTTSPTTTTTTSLGSNSNRRFSSAGPSSSCGSGSGSGSGSYLNTPRGSSSSLTSCSRQLTASKKVLAWPVFEDLSKLATVLTPCACKSRRL